MRLYRPVESWKSRSTFLLALTASTVGMGNLWRLPYLLGEHGGAPFMLAYLLSLLVLSAPLLAAELVIGALGRRSPLLSMAWVATMSDRSRVWVLAALLALLSAFLLLALLLPVGAWSLHYAFHQQLGSFAAIGLAETETFLAETLARPWQAGAWLALAAGSLALASAPGVRRGLGAAVWLAVPLLLVILTILFEFATDQGDFAAAGAWLFARQPMDFDPTSLTLAMGHALYTLAVGSAVGLSFGAYSPARIPLLRCVLAVVVFDLVIAMTLGLITGALLFANNLQPAEGPGLLFVALPYAFGNIPFGDAFGTLFFLATFVIAMAAGLALLEPLVSSLVQLARLSRPRAAAVGGLLAWSLSMLLLHSLRNESPVAGLYAALDGWLTQFLLPLGALLIALFAGWRIPRRVLARELRREPDFLVRLWYFALRFLVPTAIVLAWIGARLDS